MADSIQWINHVELYVNSSATPYQQSASVDAVATLLKNDLLTLEALVREMEMYLTTTDSIIRSRGILLLAELVAQLTSKPLSRTSIHSLIGFFSEKLADWKALRGAIVGCLALLRRKKSVGIVIDSEAKLVAQSYLQNLQVQSLGLYDRKLSFQLMECLLDCYSGAIKDLGDNLVYGICEAIDGEKDPQCLFLVFRIVERLAGLYPGVSGPLANYAEDLFDILGCYFPIHFTHPKGENGDVKREDLSKALMLAFAATPLFEPFSIPLLIEKLSSSLPVAKVESLRYLSYCATKYGPERIAKHAGAIWSSIKDATYATPQSILLAESEAGGMNFVDSDITMEASALLREAIRQYADFINLIIGDNDINLFMNSLVQYKEFDGLSLQDKQRLYMVGRILSICAESSVALCNTVFESFFLLLMNGLGLSVAQPPENDQLDEYCSSPIKVNFGALYLCIELLAACRYLMVSLGNCISIQDFSHQICHVMISRFSKLLMEAFISLLRSNIADNEQNAYFYFGVKGLQILATFPGSFCPVPKSVYDKILLELVSIVISNANKAFPWKMALKALVEIGFFIDKYPDPEKAAGFDVTVVERIVSLISSDDSAMPSSLKLQAAVEIGATRKDFMLRVVHGLDQSIHTNFSAILRNGNPSADELTTELLDTYSQKVLPWFIEVEGSEEIPLKFALNIWDKIENATPMNHGPLKITSDFLVAAMNAMKKAVASCSKGSQEMIINKALGVLFTSSGLEFNTSNSGGSVLKEEGLEQTPNFGNSDSTNEWLTSLFASVVISLRPQTSIPNGKVILQLFITNLLNGHISSAHALGSLANKLPLETMGVASSGILSLNEVLDKVFHSYIGTSLHRVTSGNDGNEINFSSLRLKTLTIQSKMNSIIGLAWIGKGLLMRGHEKVKDITLALLSVLTSDREEVSKQFQNEIDDFEEEDMHRLMECAGDAFHIIMSDSEECLNKTYHAYMKPLYKQRFFSTITPVLLSLVVKSELSSPVRSVLYRAFAHIVIDTPLSAIFGEAKKLVPALLNCLSLLKDDPSNKEIIYNILLIISGILVEKNGHEAAVENAPSIADQLINLTTYSHKMAIRETALQCLVALSRLPRSRIYPLRKKVVCATLKALGDPKRIVRYEAVRCRQAWASIA